MTHRERAATALDRGQPDHVPTFELVFHETEHDFDGRTFFGAPSPPDSTGKSIEEMIRYNAQLYVDVARRFDHDIIFLASGMPPEVEDHAQGIVDTTQAIRDLTGDEYMIMAHGDGTFGIPSGEHMSNFIFWLADKPEEAKDQAKRQVEGMLNVSRKYMEGGLDGFIQCADYAFNAGPFLSPSMFSEFVTPFLKELTEEQRNMGAYVIKHTDGDIMPIIDQLVDAGPHALHSLDPMAGVDIKVVKERYKDRIALCGNVHCAHLQTGTPEQIAESAEYCMKWGKPGGGYIFCTSNCVFRGMPIESYYLIHSIYMKHRDY